MNFEELQKAWQAQPAGNRVTIDPEFLLKEVRRKQSKFLSTIFWRDVREVGVAWLLAPYFLWAGILRHNWTFDLIGVVCFGIGLFMVVDRLIQRKKRPHATDPLKNCVATSLQEVKHQIWLLQNVWWWYLLPLAIPICLAHVASLRRSHETGLHLVMAWVVSLSVDIALFVGIYWLNQWAVRKSLAPRRQELENLLASLE